MKGLILQDLTPRKRHGNTDSDRGALHQYRREYITVKQLCERKGYEEKSIRNFMSKHKCTLEQAEHMYKNKSPMAGRRQENSPWRKFII